MDSVVTNVYNSNVDRITLINHNRGDHSDPIRIQTNNSTHKESNDHVIKSAELGHGAIAIDDGDGDANDRNDGEAHADADGDRHGDGHGHGDADGDGDGDGDGTDKRKDNSKNGAIAENPSPKPSVSRKLRSAPANRHVIPCSLDPTHAAHRHSSPNPMVIHHNFLKKKSSSPTAYIARSITTRKHSPSRSRSPSSSSVVIRSKRRHSLARVSAEELSTSPDTVSSLPITSIPSQKSKPSSSSSNVHPKESISAGALPSPASLNRGKSVMPNPASIRGFRFEKSSFSPESLSSTAAGNSSKSGRLKRESSPSSSSSRMNSSMKPKTVSLRLIPPHLISPRLTLKSGLIPPHLISSRSTLKLKSSPMAQSVPSSNRAKRVNRPVGTSRGTSQHLSRSAENSNGIYRSNTLGRKSVSLAENINGIDQYMLGGKSISSAEDTNGIDQHMLGRKSISSTSDLRCLPNALEISRPTWSDASDSENNSDSEIIDDEDEQLSAIDVKAGDDVVRLDLRSQKVRSLDFSLVHLTPKLEFVYLRDNKLANLAAIEILKNVKVLDLSSNRLKGYGLEPLAKCKALQQLYLAGNQITSLSGLPQLPNLEFLSVSQNKLKSLAMAMQPRLRVLTASKNKISTFKGFPHLPLLEHLRLEENPISGMQHLEAAVILLAGPTLKKFNDKDLPLEEVELARLYPAHTALCIRDGWVFCNVHEAFESTMKYLKARWFDKIPPGYDFEQAFIEKPSEGYPCSCHFTFVKHTNNETEELALRYQWFIGGKIPENFIPIENATKEVYIPKHDDVGLCLKVECTPVLGETEYPSIFVVSFPVSPGSGCPKVISLTLDGKLEEGHVIRGHVEIAWCGGTPGKGIVSWLRRHDNQSPSVVVGAEELEYQLSLDDVGANLLLMYTPVTQEGVKGETRFATTEVVHGASPSVSNLYILGDVVEGNTIKGVGTYFGGKEGQSKFEWLREGKKFGEFNSVAKGTKEYTLSKEDAGSRMMFTYTPVNHEGHHGDTPSAISMPVTLAPPKVSKLRIVGDICEGSKVVISAIILGGVESASRVQWFKTKIRDESLDDTNLEAISTSKISKAFRIPLDAVGFYLAAKYTPIRADGESGKPEIAFSDVPVRMLPPSLSFLSITGEYVEGETLTVSYSYVGGHEGRSQYNWYLLKNERDSGELQMESAGYLQYYITKEAINRFVSFKCIPVREDGLVGEEKTVVGRERIQPGVPKLLSLEILGDPIEGGELHVEKTYWGGNEGISKLQWFLMTLDGKQLSISGATGYTYTCQTENINSHLFVSCEPTRSDGVKGPVVISQHVGPVLSALPTCNSLELFGDPIEGETLSFIAAYYGGERGQCVCEWIRLTKTGQEQRLTIGDVLNLTLEDVGSRIKLVYTPVRKDSVVGTSMSVVSDVIKDANPVGLSLVVPDCCQDMEVVPQRSYFGGIEGDVKFAWFRLQEVLRGNELSPDAEFLGESRTYTPTLDDVGSYLVLEWIPMRLDGKEGIPCFAYSNSRVSPASPSVHNVSLIEVSQESFIGEGTYHGGYEGESKFSWYREKSNGTMSLISGANTKTYVVQLDDYTCSLIFGYTPIREDGVAGNLVLSDPSDVILPEIPKIEKLVLTGRAVEGEVLTALEVMPKGKRQERVWEYFKKEVKYQWSRSIAPGDASSFELLLAHQDSSYKICTQDIGYILHCECVITDIFGRSSSSVSVVSAIIAPGFPKISKLEIEGLGYHSNLYALRGIYFGGKEGNSIFQWFRAMSGSPDLILIPGEVGPTYQAHVDDVGYRLVAVYTPIREDDVEGAPVSASSEPIAVEPDITKEVKEKLELGSVKFEVLRGHNRSSVKLQHQQGRRNYERRALYVNKKRVKVIKPGSKTSFSSTEIRGTYAPPFHVEVFRNDPHRFKIVVDSDNEVELMVQSRHLRDVIVLVIRGFVQSFNSTPLNLLLKM